MDKLPSTKDYSKKVELISRYVDWSIAIFNRYENMGLNKTARYSYTERVQLIRYILSKYYSQVQLEVSEIIDSIIKNKEKGNKLQSLDNVIYQLFKGANLEN